MSASATLKKKNTRVTSHPVKISVSSLKGSSLFTSALLMVTIKSVKITTHEYTKQLL